MNENRPHLHYALPWPIALLVFVPYSFYCFGKFFVIAVVLVVRLIIQLVERLRRR